MEETLEKFEIEESDRDLYGFWVYLMSDLLTFAVLFAAFAVLHNNIADGPSSSKFINLNFVFIETIILLTSSFTAGLATLAMNKEKKKSMFAWFGVTFLLGVTFLVMELNEFRNLILDGAGPSRSASFSSFFALVGAHGFHIFIGLLWMSVACIIVNRQGLTIKNKSNLERLSLFWHFLGIVWIFIFTVVYLIGVL